jgi:phytoene dehydrogenase-like protein
VPAADAIVVGAGCNGLAAAVLLARAGWTVTVLEREDEPGGAIRTAEATLPGFKHDLYATNLNLFLGGSLFAELGAELARHRFEVVRATRPFGSAFPNGAFVGVSTDEEETLASIRRVSDRDAAGWPELAAWFGRLAPHLFPLLGSPMPSAATVRALWRGWRELGTTGGLDAARLVLQSTRELVEESFESREVQAAVAAWGMHLDFPPDVPGGALFAFLETFASAAHGLALGRGGARTLVDALVSMLREAGGELVTAAEVERIAVGNGVAHRVEVRGGRQYDASRAVIANVTPAVLAQLLGAAAAGDLRRRLERYRYAPGTLMVHLALEDLPRWFAGDAVRSYAYVHVGPYLEDMSLAYHQALSGLLPERPTLVVGQPTAVDPSRAPEGKHVLWVQARVLPARIRGDAAGEIAATDWDEAKDAYADRVLALLEEVAPGLSGLVLGRHVLSPLDLERANPNLVGGDQLGGSMHAAQNFFLRPFPGWSRYRTPIAGLYLCGAATWPGAGVGAGSGYLLAKELTRPRGLARLGR